MLKYILIMNLYLQDVHMLRDALPKNTVKDMFRVDWPLFNHIDFVTANDADTLVYNNVLQILNSLL